MNVVSHLVDRITDTQNAIRKLEASLRDEPSSLSLQLHYKSLQKRKQDLEADFFDCAAEKQMSVCAYRWFQDNEGLYPVEAIGGSLKNFQVWFSNVYSSLKSGKKVRGRLGAEMITESCLYFAFSYTGSLGVVLTIPKENLLFEDFLQLSMNKTIEMLQAGSSEQIHHFAAELGAPPIRALYAWVGDHVNSGLGADIRWMKGQQVFAEATVGSNHLKNLKQAIEETSDEETTTFTVRAQLVGADIEKHTFHILIPEGEEIRGRMADGIGEIYSVELPQTYEAEIEKTSSINYATEEEKTSYFLKSLRKI